MNKHPLRKITSEHKQTYALDGVVVLRGMFDSDWIKLMHSAAEKVMANPTAYGIPGPSQGNDMTSVCHMWRKPGEFRDFVFNSPAAEITGKIIGSSTIRMYHDHLFIKPPNSRKIMRWHHDATAWPVTGEQVPNLWLSLTRANEQSGRVEFLAGYPKYCLNNNIVYGFNNDQASGICPDFEKRREDPNLNFVSFDLDPGDVVLFHPLMPHHSKGNSSDKPRIGLALRLFGDDVLWSPASHKAPIPDVEQLPAGQQPQGKYFPILWQNT